MGFVVDSLSENVILVFFVYGLAFFVMGLAIALENKKPSGLKLAASLSFLAAFGFVHSIVEWAEMFMLVRTQALGLDVGAHYQILKMFVLPFSALFLIQFGVTLVVDTLQRHFWLKKWISIGLLLLWAVAVGAFRVAGAASNQELFTTSEVFARYFLYLPGSILAAIGLALQRDALKALNLPRVARDCRWASFAFGLNAIVAGLIVPSAPFFPASAINYDAFTLLTDLPPQVFRGVAALAIAYFIVRVLRVFEVEQARRFDLANQQRFQAQQEALEAQRQVQQATERWTKELEERVEQRTEEIAQRNRELSVLNTVAQSITQSWDLDNILNRILSQILEFTGALGGGMFLLSAEDDALVLRVATGVPGTALRSLLCYEPTSHPYVTTRHLLASWLKVGVEVEKIDEASNDPNVEPFTIVCVPLESKENNLGSLIFVKAGQNVFTDNDIRLLVLIGRQVAVAIDNARLLDRVQNLAVLEERDRIAREMHDGLAQVLGYLNLQTHTIEQMLSTLKVAQVQEEIRQMRKVVQDAYADVRECILSLRTSISSSGGLLPTLAEYLSDFEKQAKIPVELVVENGVPARFPSAVEVQLVRIVQEALTNVRKHSRATMAWVRIEGDANGTRVMVEDNGRGFFVQAVAGQDRQHFGLQTMRERAESVGCELLIDSDPGKGTKVIVRLPKEIEGGQTQYGSFARAVG